MGVGRVQGIDAAAGAPWASNWARRPSSSEMLIERFAKGLTEDLPVSLIVTPVPFLNPRWWPGRGARLRRSQHDPPHRKGLLQRSPAKRLKSLSLECTTA